MHHTPVGPFRYDLIPNDMTFFIMPKCSWAQYLIYHTLWVIQSSKRIHTTEASTNLLPIILPPSFTRSMQELLLQQQMLLPMNHQLLVSQYDAIEIQSNIHIYHVIFISQSQWQMFVSIHDEMYGVLIEARVLFRFVCTDNNSLVRFDQTRVRDAHHQVEPPQFYIFTCYKENALRVTHHIVVASPILSGQHWML
eukprot:882801_1